MTVGARLETVLSSAVATPSLGYSGFLRPWSAVLGSVIGGLLLGSVAYATPQLAGDKFDEVTPTSTVTASEAIADGFYLYGSAPERGRLGAAYMVFAAQNSHLMGAMFMPQSSFDCFQGHREGNELALQITNSYTQEVYGYEVALVTDEAPIATAANTPLVLALDGFYNLGMPGESEMVILSTCQAQP